MENLRDEVLNMLQTNGRNLGDTAAAMAICIETFTSTDTDVEGEFNDRKKEIPYE